MYRRNLLWLWSGLFVATAAGCLGTSQRTTTPSPTTTGSCTQPTPENVIDVLPPAPAGRTRSVETDPSQASLDEHNADTAVSADYRDNDDDVLDDYTVRVFRFQDNVDARRTVVQQLNAIEFDSGRVGVGVLLGRTGIIAAAPRRRQASSLLARSPALTTGCIDRHKLMPTKTRTPATGDETPRETGAGT